MPVREKPEMTFLPSIFFLLVSVESAIIPTYGNAAVPQTGTWKRTLPFKVGNMDLNRTDLQLVIPDETIEVPENMSRQFNATQLAVLSTIAFLKEPCVRDVWPNNGFTFSNTGVVSVAKLLSNSSNITQTFASVAQSMTNHT